MTNAEKAEKKSSRVKKHREILNFIIVHGIVDVPANWARAAVGAAPDGMRPYSITRHAHGALIKVIDVDALRRLLENLGKPKPPRVLAKQAVRKALEGGGRTVRELCAETKHCEQTVRRELRKLADRGIAARSKGRVPVWGLL